VRVGLKVSHKNLSERVLKLTVCDVDRLRRHNVIGGVVFALRGREDDVTGRTFYTSLRLEHADNVTDAVSLNFDHKRGLSNRKHKTRFHHLIQKHVKVG